MKDEVTMCMGNDCQVDVLAVSTKNISLPSGLVLILNKFYYVPTLSVNIVSGSCLKRDHYSFKSDTIGCAIHKDDVFYTNMTKSIMPHRHVFFITRL